MKKTLQAYREEARTARYENSTQEAETVAAVDAAVRDRVQDWERTLMGQADALIAQGDEQAAAAEELMGELLNEVRVELESPDSDLEAVALRWRQLETTARKAIAALESKVAGIDNQISRLSDPQASLQHVMSKYPGMHKGRELI